MSEEKMTKRQIQAIKTKKKIYNISVELMNKKGFNNTTIEEISKKAGVSVGAFYHYYKSKEDIFFDLYQKADEYFENEVTKYLEDENSINQIILYFKYYAKYTEERGLENTSQLYNTKNKLFIAKGRYMKILLQDIISKGQEKNEISKDMTPESLTDYLFIVARGIVYDWCLHNAEYNLTEYMVKFIERFVVVFKKNK